MGHQRHYPKLLYKSRQHKRLTWFPAGNEHICSKILSLRDVTDVTQDKYFTWKKVRLEDDLMIFFLDFLRFGCTFGNRWMYIYGGWNMDESRMDDDKFWMNSLFFNG